MTYSKNNKEILELKKKYNTVVAVKEILKSNESDTVINAKLKKFGFKLYAPELPGVVKKSVS